MKTELMNIPGKGICIVISEINPNDFVFGDGKIFYGGVFSDVMTIANAIRSGKKILAIKETRAQTGWGLKEAKEYIDKFIDVPYSSPPSVYNRCADEFIRAHRPEDLIDKDEFSV